MTADRLGLRALNRATLERQLLLRRAALAPRQAVEHLAGLQAQAPLAPYVGLWARLAGFRHQQLKDLLTERAVVRAHLMRNTVHLVTAEDFVGFRPLFQPKIDRDLAAHYGRNLAIGGQGVGVDLAEVRQAARALLAERPLTRGQLAAELAARWPDHDPASLAYAATHLLSLVQVPPRGLWGETGQAAFFLADAWLDGLGGSPPDPARPQDTREQLVMRYLAAYGPASVRDIQAWSGLSKLREVTERLCTGQHGPSAGPVNTGLFNTGPGCARSPVPTAASSSTCRTRRRRTPIPRRRPGSCPNTTTCCSPSPTAAGSSRTAARSRCRPATAAPEARCSSTGFGRPTGRSSAIRAGPSWRSGRSSS